MTYKVKRAEFYWATYRVVADSEEEALERVDEGHPSADRTEVEFNCWLEDEQTDVREVTT